MKQPKYAKKVIAALVCMLMLAGTYTMSGAASTGTATTTTNTSTAPQGTPPSGNPPSGSPPSGDPKEAPPSGSAAGTAPGSSQGATVTATAVYEISGKTTTQTNKTYTTSTVNKSGVIAAKSSKVTLKNITVNKTGGNTTSEDESNFYALNAGVASKSGSTITVSDSKISTAANGSNAIFATGTGSVINVSNTTLKTTKDSSRGLDATMGGKVNATNVTINTAGTHCAAIATDRGNGTINVTGGSMTTTGKDSPGIYSTGTIKATNATIKATGAEAAVVEGKNSITLSNVKISGEKTNGVMLYQSFSGDAETGTAVFTMTGGSLSSKAGSLFFVTNTDSVATLKNVAVKNTTGVLITAAATQRWGTTGANGGKLKFIADHETLTGKVVCDNISSVAITLKNNTSYSGSINTDNKLAKVSITLDASSKWTVTADSYVLSLIDADASLKNIQSNGHSIYYDSTNSANSWLGGKTITLADGGTLAPMK